MLVAADYPFLDILWTMLIFFLWIASFWILITVFADMRDSSTMAAQSREVASDWLRAHKQHIRASHILVRSKLIEMAMSVISMVVGGGLLHVYSRVPEFMQALHGAAPGLLDLPNIAHVAA